jgi:hypothetical protein
MEEATLDNLSVVNGSASIHLSLVNNLDTVSHRSSSIQELTNEDSLVNSIHSRLLTVLYLRPVDSSPCCTI